VCVVSTVLLCCNQLRTDINPSGRSLYFKIDPESPVGMLQDPKVRPFTVLKNTKVNTQLVEAIDRPLGNFLSPKIAWIVKEDIQASQDAPVILWLEGRHMYNEDGKRITRLPKRKEVGWHAIHL